MDRFIFTAFVVTLIVIAIGLFAVPSYQSDPPKSGVLSKIILSVLIASISNLATYKCVVFPEYQNSQQLVNKYKWYKFIVLLFQFIVIAAIVYYFFL